MSEYHAHDVDYALSSLNASPAGLTREEAQKRLSEYGPNEIVAKGRASPFVLWLSQFKDFLIIILLAAVLLSAILGETIDAVVIFVIILFATTLGFIQEFRAEKAMEALKKMAAPTASVLREGKEVEVRASEIVPGDIVKLATGDKVPADIRLIQAINLKTEEGPLTGESVPVEKINGVVASDVGIGDRRNIAFMGTAVVYGRGLGVVISTGMATEFGKIATMLEGVKQQENSAAG